MKRKELLKLIVGFGLVVVLAVSIPLMSGCAAPGPAPTPTPEPTPTPTPTPEEPIKIGFAAHVTGVMSEDTRHMQRVYEVAIDEINAAGGLLGRPLELVVVDLANNTPAELVAARDALMAADVDVIHTSWWLNPKGILYMHEVGVFVVQYGWVSDDWEAWYAVKDEYPHFVQLNRDEEGYGVPWFQALVNPEMITWEYPNKKAAILMPDFGYSIKQATFWREEAERHGWEIVLEEIHPIGSVEFGPQMTKVREEEPAIIFMCTNFVTEIIAAYTDFIEDPTNSLFAVTFALTKPEFIDALGTKADGVVGTVPACNFLGGEYTGQNPQYITHDERVTFLREEVTRRYGEAPAPGGYHADDALQVWRKAVERAGDVRDFDAILEAMFEYPHTGALGRFPIDRETHASSYGADKIPLLYYQTQGGVPVTLAIGDGADVEHLTDFEMPWWLE